MNSTIALSPTNQPLRLIKLAEVKAQTTLSTSEVYRRIAAGTFPPQVKLGPKSVAWLKTDIDGWCEAQVAASRGALA